MRIKAGRLFAISLAIVAVLAPTVRAADAWTSGADPTVSAISPQPYVAHCNQETVSVVGVNGTGDICLYQANNYRYGVFSHYVNDFGSYRLETYFVVSIGSDTHLYKVTNFNLSLQTVYVPGSSDLFVRAGGTYLGPAIGVIHNFVSQLQRGINANTAAIEYTLPDPDNKIDYLLKNGSGTPMSTSGSLGVSDSGRWIAAFVSGSGLFKIDTSNYSVQRFSTVSPPYGQGMDPRMEFAVADDGVHIASMGLSVPFDMYSITTTCGQSSRPSDDPDWQSPISTPCTSKSLSGLIPNYGWVTTGVFDITAQSLTLQNSQFGVGNQWYRMSLPGYSPHTLDYLAMGDSYSSGEGDTEVDQATHQKFYRPLTDNEENPAINQPREKCHLSTRSYPYKLALAMGLGQPTNNPNTSWQSVACSGAAIWDIKEQASDNYKGQAKGPRTLLSSDGGDERLKNYFYDVLKTQALNEFIPGRQKQVMFMKEYHPKAITLTIGGNDVDFGGKISTCIRSLATSCKLATEQGRKDLGTELQGEFKNLTSLYQKLHDASPSTKIYVLGYPQAINGVSNDVDCLGYSIGGLDSSERRVIAEGYSYFDKVLEAAAQYVGVKYINIEDAFNGHRICDGLRADHYVTGFTFGNPLDKTNERQESFHPNAKGNQAIADKISDDLKVGANSYTPLTYPYTQQPDQTVVAPAPTGYLAFDITPDKIVQTTHMIDDSVTKTAITTTAFNPYMFAADSVVKFILHSDPIDLGEYRTNADGSLNVNITVPTTVPAGYHTLIATGKTYSGEPVQYEQVIFVHGSDPNDIDEDGIPDNADKCLFITPSNVDKDSDGIDDACDLDVGPPKDAYRIRAGDPSRTYNGAPELANYLYIERNIYATSMTDISGDYDPDHDGWAVIAASQNPSQAGPYARFWVDGTDPNKIPHVSLRTSENGCVQYKPSNLSKVTDSSTRTLLQEATDTNTCRSDPPTADLDNNGQPDNIQPLYRARNGDPIKGEDPTRLYLERSTRAAEAQLGKSDYAANDTTIPISPTDITDHRQAWSLVASSQPYLPTGTYKKLQLQNSQFYVVTTILPPFNFCTAYKPQSLGTIKKSTQATRLLQVDLIETITLQLQGGCNG